MKKFFLLDANNFLFRAYHAIPLMTNERGESTNALFGFIRSIVKILADFSPDYIAAVFDGADNKKSRTAIYADYKSHRQRMPEDLYAQSEKAHLFCKLFGIPTLSIEGVEADDTIGTLVSFGKKHHLQTFLCTSDKDLCQLVDDHVFVLHAHKNNLIIDKKKVFELFGVHPEQIVDYLALIGDSSDNIPGVEGIGPKTASSLLAEFHTLDNLLKHVDCIPGKKGELMKAQQEQALISQKLATLDLSVNIPRDLDFYKLTPPSEDLQPFYLDQKFFSLAQEKPVTIKEEHLSYELVSSKKALDQLLEKLQKEPEICLDTETTELSPTLARLVGVGLGVRPGEAWYIPCHGNLTKEEVLSFLRTLFSTESIRFYGHNIKYDCHVFANENLPLPTIGFDTILASYLLTPHIPQHNLDHLSLERLGKKKIPIEALIGKGKNRISMLEVPLEKICAYCCEDVDCTIRLKELFLKELQEKKLLPLLQTVELPLLPILFVMERTGIFLDTAKLKQLSSELAEKLTKVEEEIYQMAGEKLNLNSPKQLSCLLFDQMKLKPPKKTQTGFSTSADALELIQHESPIIPLILQYRQLEKLRSTYVDALPLQVHPITHRIHCTFNQSMTATGRLSCQNPNLQNIPVRGDEGKKIRAAFLPQKAGWSYLSADYSQIELRLLAHFSEDPILLKAFHQGEDIHTYTASVVFNVPLQEVTSEMRYKAKAVNFGILYGQQAFGLSQGLSISTKEAAAFINTYFERYPKVKEYLESSKKQVQSSHIAYTLIGRQRPIPEIHSKNPTLKAQAERLAINTPLQGTAADLIKLAMILIQEKNHFKHPLLILQIHDELLFEVPDAELEDFGAFVKKEMESVFQLKVPLVVDISVGKNWGAC